MDYSLLVGVHDLKQAEEDAANAAREGTHLIANKMNDDPWVSWGDSTPTTDRAVIQDEEGLKSVAEPL